MTAANSWFAQQRHDAVNLDKPENSLKQSFALKVDFPILTGSLMFCCNKWKMLQHKRAKTVSSFPGFQKLFLFWINASSSNQFNIHNYKYGKHRIQVQFKLFLQYSKLLNMCRTVLNSYIIPKMNILNKMCKLQNSNSSHLSLLLTLLWTLKSDREAISSSSSRVAEEADILDCCCAGVSSCPSVCSSVTTKGVGLKQKYHSH